MRAGIRLFALGLLASLLGWGCELSNPGVDPPDGELNFPVAITTSATEANPSARFLYVTSSNFDLRFNAGSAMSIDLDRVDSMLPADPVRTADPLVIDASEVLVNEVRFGSHASAMVLSPDGDRLFLAVRSDANLTYIDVVDGRLSCGPDAKLCDDDHRRGDDFTANPRRLEVPLEPTGVAVGRLSDLEPGRQGDYVITSHRSGAASLFLDAVGPAGRRAPLLVHVIDELPLGAINLTIDPTTQTAWLPTIDVSQSSRDNFVGRVGVALDSAPELSFLYDAGDVVLSGVNTGEDTRDVKFDTLPDGSRLAYLLTRAPEALVVIDLDRSTSSRLFVRDIVSVGFGPSRMTVADVPVGATGETRRLVFVTCFDSQDVWIVDPLAAEVITVARTLSGPYQLALDTPRHRMYVGDFRSSVVWVVSLAPLEACLDPSTEHGASCEPFRIASIGTPRPVREQF